MGREYSSALGKKTESAGAATSAINTLGSGGETTQSTDGIDYYYDGTNIRKGNENNGLDHNRIVKTDGKGRPKSGNGDILDIGKTKIRVKKFDADDGIHFTLVNERDKGRDIFVFLMGDSGNEWSFNFDPVRARMLDELK